MQEDGDAGIRTEILVWGGQTVADRGVGLRLSPFRQP
jgi:hypothetical protein